MKKLKTKSKMTYVISGVAFVFFILLGIVVPVFHQVMIEARGNMLGLYIWQKIVLGINLPIGLTIGIIVGFVTILKDKYCSRKLSFILNILIIILILLIAFLVPYASSGPGLGMAA